MLAKLEATGACDFGAQYSIGRMLADVYQEFGAKLEQTADGIAAQETLVPRCPPSLAQGSVSVGAFLPSGGIMFR